MMKKFVMVVSGLLSMLSCSPEFLEVKPDRKLVVPTTVKDLQALLDKSDLMNQYLPSLGQLSTDDHHFNDTDWRNSADFIRKNAYSWQRDIFEGSISIDWNYSYQQVFYANLVLEGLDQMIENSTLATKTLRGSAHFYRAHAFYNIAQIFCAPYNTTSSNSGLGIPLRLSSDINKKSIRATIADTYEQIVDDLLRARDLLPEENLLKTRPDKGAAEALLARTYLLMQNYEQALLYAEKVISRYSLINYIDLDGSEDYPIGIYNDEVIFHATMWSYMFPASSDKVNMDLYNSYATNDLRKKIWYVEETDGISYKGSYGGDFYMFCGLALDEMYLVKSESLVRLDRVAEGVLLFNKYLQTRFKDNEYSPIDVGTPEVVLDDILQERRKALAFRGVRWSDLRRLNLDPQTQTTLRRTIDGVNIELHPNSRNYVLPIPDVVLELTGMSQNSRD